MRAVRSLPVGYQLVRVEGTSTAQGAAALERRSSVRSVEPNYAGYRPTAVPNDPFFADDSSWGLHNGPLSVLRFGGVEDADIAAPEAWDLARGSSDVVVAVVDTGMRNDHPDLAPRLWTNPGEVPGDGRDNDSTGKVDDVHGWNVHGNNASITDTNGHGTHVAGTIGAAGNDGFGPTGVAWDSRLMVVKVLDPTRAGRRGVRLRSPARGDRRRLPQRRGRAAGRDQGARRRPAPDDDDLDAAALPSFRDRVLPCPPDGGCDVLEIALADEDGGVPP